MDEVTMLASLRPAPPADVEQMRQRTKLRLDAALTAVGPADPARAPRKSSQRVALAVAVAAAAVGAAIAVPALLPGSADSIITPAWAVQRSADGTITVTINKTLRDQAGLQRALRAEGVPAYVRPMSGCKYWTPPGGRKHIKEDWKALLFPAPGNHDRDFGAIIIHPAALPKADAVFIGGGALGAGGLALQLFVMHNDGPPVCVPGHGVQVVTPNSQPAPSYR